MIIEIWSDFACPYCYIGKRHLERAIGARDDVEVVLRAYELNPRAPVGEGRRMMEEIRSKYGLAPEQMRAEMDAITRMAADVGLEYHPELWVAANTFDAHRLELFAAEKGLGNAFGEAALHAAFVEGAALDDEATLLRLAETAGLDAREAREVLGSGAYAAQVREDESAARALDVRAVPFFLRDGVESLTGAQPVEVFKGFLLHAMKL